MGDFRKEIRNRMFGKSENTLIAKLHNRIDDTERIEKYIKLVCKIGEIPKGQKHIDKTLYRKLNDKIFLALTLKKIRDKIKSRYNISPDRIELLKDLELYLSQKFDTVKKKENKLNNQVKTVEYKDELDYEKQHKKKNRTPEY